MLCVWWDHPGIVYHELLKPAEGVNEDVCWQQFINLNHALLVKTIRMGHEMSDTSARQCSVPSRFHRSGHQQNSETGCATTPAIFTHLTISWSCVPGISSLFLEEWFSRTIWRSICLCNDNSLWENQITQPHIVLESQLPRLFYVHYRNERHWTGLWPPLSYLPPAARKVLIKNNLNRYCLRTMQESSSRRLGNKVAVLMDEIWTLYQVKIDRKYHFMRVNINDL